jgi:hypothetical protein
MPPATSRESLDLENKKVRWAIAVPREKIQVTKDFSAAVKEDNLDVCRVTIGFMESWLKARTGGKEAIALLGPNQQISIKQKNIFQYQVVKPRREPFSLNCVKPEFRRTFSSILFEAYVLDKARRKLKGEFCFRDFLELEHDSFRRIVLRLKRKGLVVAVPQRTIPRLYLLAEDIKIS